MDTGRIVTNESDKNCQSPNKKPSLTQFELRFPATLDPFTRGGVHSIVDLTNKKVTVKRCAYVDAGKEARGIATRTGLPSKRDWWLEVSRDLEFNVPWTVQSSAGILYPIHDNRCS